MSGTGRDDRVSRCIMGVLWCLWIGFWLVLLMIRDNLGIWRRDREIQKGMITSVACRK
jgi:hypothetical protein